MTQVGSTLFLKMKCVLMLLFHDRELNQKIILERISDDGVCEKTGSRIGEIPKKKRKT